MSLPTNNVILVVLVVGPHAQHVIKAKVMKFLEVVAVTLRFSCSQTEIKPVSHACSSMLIA